MENGRAVGRVTCELLLALALLFLSWSWIPGARQQVRLMPSPVSFKIHTLNIKEIQLDLPKTLRSGEAEYIRLQVQPEDGSPSAALLAEARLELPAAEVAPGEVIQTAFSATGPTRFECKVQRTGQGELTGTLWLSFRQGDESQVVLAYPLVFQDRRLAGLPLRTVRLAGWFGLAIGLAGCLWTFHGKR